MRISAAEALAALAPHLSSAAAAEAAAGGSVGSDGVGAPGVTVEGLVRTRLLPCLDGNPGLGSGGGGEEAWHGKHGAAASLGAIAAIAGHSALVGAPVAPAEAAAAAVAALLPEIVAGLAARVGGGNSAPFVEAACCSGLAKAFRACRVAASSTAGEHDGRLLYHLQNQFF